MLGKEDRKEKFYCHWKEGIVLIKEEKMNGRGRKNGKKERKAVKNEGMEGKRFYCRNK